MVVLTAHSLDVEVVVGVLVHGVGVSKLDHHGGSPHHRPVQACDGNASLLNAGQLDEGIGHWGLIEKTAPGKFE